MPPLYLAPLYDRDEQGVNLKIQVKVEKWRCIAYGFFWTMVVFAKLMTTLFVDEILKDGADPSVPLEQKGCGPFNRVSLRYFSSFTNVIDDINDTLVVNNRIFSHRSLLQFYRILVRLWVLSLVWYLVKDLILKQNLTWLSCLDLVTSVRIGTIHRHVN